MGLDMNLYKKTYVKNWSFMDEAELHQVSVSKGGVELTDIKPERVCYILEDVGYWRKFNALHNWIVIHCADGVDECQDIYVDTDKIEELVSILGKVKNNNDLAEELLPTAEGFFFGGTEYDEYYFEQVERTLKMFEDLLEEKGSKDFYYRASW
jgi:hypothetical protein